MNEKMHLGLDDIHQTTQVIAGVVAADNLSTAQELERALNSQDRAFAQALREINHVREFVGTPENILGNSQTKHGEIAEQVEVGVRRAQDLLNHQSPSATFEGVGRTAPVDYRIDGVDVQSKFVNGLNKNLSSVLDHMKQYDHFGRNGSYYHIPKDHYELIQRISAGETVEGISSATAQKVQQQIRNIEQLSGKSFGEVVKPGISEYADVQQGKIHSTLENHEKGLDQEQKNLKESIRLEHQPSMEAMAKVALQGAAIAATLKVTFKIYEKHKQGRNLFKGDFTSADWQDLGVTAVEGGITGSISGASIYALTNFAQLSAPFAGSVVSAGFAISELGRRYMVGEITADQFLNLGQIACAEAAIVGIGATVGQALIPVPVLGAVVGTIAGRMLMSLCKPFLAKESTRFQAKLEAYYRQSLAKIDHAYHEVINQIVAKYELLGELTKAAFDPAKNTALRLQASIELAEAYNVPQSEIIHNIDELDAFMLS